MSYEILAVHYTERQARRCEVFYGDFDQSPVTLAYFIWVIRGRGRTVLVDLGFTEEVARKRGRQLQRTIPECLRQVGLSPADIRDVIITHFHFDHVGTYRLFPNATFWVQEAEMSFFTGPLAHCYPFNVLAEAADVAGLVELNFAGRVRFIDGDRELWPGISVHRVGGHSPGLQVVRVETDRGRAVIASDAAHFYRNLEARLPFYLLHSVADAHRAFDRVLELADSPELILPGHDPAVLERFEKVGDGVVRLG